MRDHVELAPAPADAPPGGRIAAVVVSHNRMAQLRRTVERLLEEGVDHLVVVDNASTDGTRDWLAGLAEPRLHVVLSPRNQGGAGGFEQGLRAASALYDPDWFLVMDDDARPLAGTIARFRALQAGPGVVLGGGMAGVGAGGDAGGDAGGGGANGPSAPGPGGWEAVAGGVFYPDGQICETNRPSLNPFWHVRSFLRTLLGGGRSGFHVADDDYAAATPVPVDAASFVGLFLSRGAIARAGYPQGDLFIYGDDVLYTLELSCRGGRIGFAPWLGFEHDCSTFRRAGGQKLHGDQIHRPLWKVYYNYRNGMFTYRRAAGPVLFWLVLLLAIPKWGLKVRGYEPGERRVYLRLLRLALGDGFRGRRDRPHRQIRALARLAPLRRGGRRPPSPGHPAVTSGE